MAKSLSDTSIRNMKPRDRDYMVGDGAGLWLRVRTSGSKTFIIRKKTAGKTKHFTLGTWPDLSLLEARRKALDPATTEPRQAVTLAELCDEFYDSEIGPKYRRPHHVRGYLDKLTDTLGKRRLDELTTREVSDFLKAYAKHGKVAANRLLAIARQALGYAVESGYITVNPADAPIPVIIGGAPTFVPPTPTPIPSPGVVVRGADEAPALPADTTSASVDASRAAVFAGIGALVVYLFARGSALLRRREGG